MNSKLTQLVRLLKENLRLFFSICIGIFLFILFFQPFPIDRFDFNNKLLFVAGLSAIVFLFMFIVRVAFPWFIQNYFENSNFQVVPSYLSSFIIVAFSSVAFAFYLFYVGSVAITFYVMFKVVLICLAPPLTLQIDDLIKELRKQNESLVLEKRTIQNQIERYEEDNLNKSIEFISESSSENLNLLIADIAFIKSADNYVEIVFKEGDDFKKKLIRNTLKNIEQQIRQYSNFIRCHRICIVNIHYIEKLNKNNNNTWLSVKGYEEQIPVSRQYILKLKEAL